MYRYDRQNKLILERWIVNIDFCYSTTLTSAILPCVRIDRYRYAYIYIICIHTYVTHAYACYYIYNHGCILCIHIITYMLFLEARDLFLSRVHVAPSPSVLYLHAPGFHAIHSGKMPLAESNLLMGHLSHGTTGIPRDSRPPPTHGA